MSSVSPGGADLVPTTPDWPAWVGFMVTTHFDLVSGPFHSPNFIGLHSVSTSANMYHLNPRAGELPRSASSHFYCFRNNSRLGFMGFLSLDIEQASGNQVGLGWTNDVDCEL